jgi:hypothetical protein
MRLQQKSQFPSLEAGFIGSLVQTQLSRLAVRLEGTLALFVVAKQGVE